MFGSLSLDIRRTSRTKSALHAVEQRFKRHFNQFAAFNRAIFAIFRVVQTCLPHLTGGITLKLLNSYEHGAGVVRAIDQEIVTKKFCHIDCLA